MICTWITQMIECFHAYNKTTEESKKYNDMKKPYYAMQDERDRIEGSIGKAEKALENSDAKLALEVVKMNYEKDDLEFLKLVLEQI